MAGVSLQATRGPDPSLLGCWLEVSAPHLQICPHVHGSWLPPAPATEIREPAGGCSVHCFTDADADEKQFTKSGPTCGEGRRRQPSVTDFPPPCGEAHTQGWQAFAQVALGRETSDDLGLGSGPEALRVTFGQNLAP